jgi:hypothetical protein
LEKKYKNKSIKNSLKNVNIENSNSESDNFTKTITTDENFDLKDTIEKNKNEKTDDIEENNKKEDSFNSTVTTIYFLLFYFPYIFMIEALTSILFIPYSYFLGIFRAINNKNSLSKSINVLIVFILWIVLGLRFIIFNYFLNLFFLCSTIFNNFDKEELNEKRRIKESITTKEIEKFMQFIHSREHKDKEDLQTLFRNFLLWENDKSDKNTRRFSNYIKKITHIGETKARNINFTLIGLNNKNTRKSFKKNSSSFSFVFSSRIYKRNIIIIEILQNFLIDNSYFIVDIEKMKMILPYTMNINNEYKKTLIYTNI